ncbi:MAG: TetR family transcriptional regulator [Gammaproteobacteria bacterium]|nr:TetR/AcrR family transcriptional regulator [Gammaproteobacteria bacterium]NNM01719.1 TetR family transcriptional regulator [Gammaproteobacteria bacterium]
MADQPVPRKKRAGTKGQKRRQQIIDAARQILIDSGYDGLVLRDVAQQIGITHGNLQYYFPTKNDLLMAIFDQAVEKYTDSMQDAVAEASTRRGRLDAIIDSGIAELKSPDVALWKMTWVLANHNEEVAAILKKENDLYEERLTGELARIAPGLSAKRRRHIARMIHAILDGLGIQYSYEDADSAEMRALSSEIKEALFTILEAR